MYDYDRLGIEPSTIVHDLPGGEWRRVQRARGYRYIMVNGEVTLMDGRTDQTDVGTVAASRQRLKRQPQAIVISQT